MQIDTLQSKPPLTPTRTLDLGPRSDGGLCDVTPRQFTHVPKLVGA